MAYRLVTEGGVADLATRLPQAENEWVGEKSLVELRLHFRLRFPGFEQTASLVDYELRRYGITPWPGEWRLIEPDPEEPVWYVRWQRGVAWAGVIVSVLWAMVVLAAVLLIWRLFVFVKEEYPWLIPVLSIGAVVLILASARPREAPT